MPVAACPPPLGIYRPVNDEAVTSPAAEVLKRTLKVYDSISWMRKFRFDGARQNLDRTVFLKDNWDTYGAEPPNDRCRKIAGQILNALEGASLIPSTVTPSAE